MNSNKEQTEKRLSVVTICRNDRESLRKTLESVRGQRVRNFQYIVIDGGSTDGSVDLIRQNEDIIDFWISEPDTGIYNAMNKGVGYARGEYCQFLNAGDCFADADVTGDVVPLLSGDYDVYYGAVLQARSNGKLKRRRLAREVTLPLLVQWTSGHLQHQGGFTRTSLLRRYPFDESFRIASDYRFWLQAYIEGESTFCFLDRTIAIFDGSGISNTEQELSLAERRRAQEEWLTPRMISELSRVPHRIHSQYPGRLGKHSERLLRVLNAVMMKILGI